MANFYTFPDTKDIVVEKYIHFRGNKKSSLYCNSQNVLQKNPR